MTKLQSPPVSGSKIASYLGLLCFFSSGACGLIYEVVWGRFLALYVGNTANSHTIVITSFMGGLALGYAIFGRIAYRFESGLRVYAIIEWIISAYALLFVFVYPMIGDAVMTWVKPFGPGSPVTTAARYGLAMAALLPPTILMGGTLPLLVHEFRPTPGYTAQVVARLYGWNSAGAVVGCLSSGLFWLPTFGIPNTLVGAAAVNAAIATLAFWVSGGFISRKCRSYHAHGGLPVPTAASGLEPASVTVNRQPQDSLVTPDNMCDSGPESFVSKHLVAGGRNVSDSFQVSSKADLYDQPDSLNKQSFSFALLLIAFFSGLMSFLLQSLWLRLFALVLGSSTYSFTIVIAACISGITAGNWVLKRWFGDARSGFLLLAVLFFGAGLTLWVPSWLYERLPWLFAHIKLLLPRTDVAFPVYLGIQVIVVSSIIVFPIGLLAMVLPTVVALGDKHFQDAPKTTGYAFAANSVGCVLAAALAAPVLIPALGARGVFFGVVVLCVLLGLWAWVRAATVPVRPKWLGAGLAVSAALVVAAFSPVWDVQVLNAGEFRKRREYVPDFQRFTTEISRGTVLFYEDAKDATITIVGKGEQRVLRVNGKADASTGGDMITQVLSAHVPLLFAPSPQAVLVVGLGSGVTAGSAAKHGVNVDVVEISSSVVRAARFFDAVNSSALTDSRVTIIEEDAKAFLRLTDKRYDVIISEPSNPWIAGNAALFSVEFFAELRNHLKDGGVVAQWLHLYEIGDGQVEMILATLTSSFPHFVVWELFPNDLIVLASVNPLDLDLQRAASRLASAEIASDVARVGVYGFPALLSLQILSGDAAKNLIPSNVDLNRDLHPRLEFLAPIGLFRGERSTLFDTADERHNHEIQKTGLLLGEWDRRHGVTTSEWENVFRLHTRYPGSPPEFRLGLVDRFIANSDREFLVALIHTLVRDTRLACPSGEESGMATDIPCGTAEAARVAEHLIARYPNDPDVLYATAFSESVRLGKLDNENNSNIVDLLIRCVDKGDDRLNRCAKWLAELSRTE